MNIQYDDVSEAGRPDITAVNKGERKYIIVDAAVPDDSWNSDKRKEKVEKCEDIW